MSLDIVNTAVLFPDPPNWASPVRVSRKWLTDVAHGAVGGEDRHSARPTPIQRVSYSLLLDKVSERTLFSHRARTAIKTGRAAVANWGVQGYANVEFSELGVAIETGRTWSADQWVLIARPDGPMINRSLLINCGGSASGSWQADQFYDVGSPRTTASAINTASVTDPATEVVYQSAREIITVDAFSTLIYTLRGWTPGVAGLVRLHFAEIDAEMAGTYQRKMDITVQGADKTVWELFEIYAAAGNALNKAHVLETFCTPGSDGVITIKLVGVHPHIEGIPSQLHYPAMINGIEAHQNTYAARQLTVGASGPLGSISWAGRLKSRYPKGSIVTPLVFGRLAAQDIDQITDEVAGVPEIAVEEPMASTSTLGVAGSCPAETGFDYPLRADPGSDEIPGTRVSSRYMWGLTGAQHPNEHLLSSQITHSKLLLEDQPDCTTVLKFFWFHVSTSFNGGIAVQKWQNDDDVWYPSDVPGSFPNGGWYLAAILA